ncbi:hypothetical protein V1478_011032, partial [Vespula squamosa]
MNKRNSLRVVLCSLKPRVPLHYSSLSSRQRWEGFKNSVIENLQRNVSPTVTPTRSIGMDDYQRQRGNVELFEGVADRWRGATAWRTTMHLVHVHRPSPSLSLSLSLSLSNIFTALRPHAAHRTPANPPPNPTNDVRDVKTHCDISLCPALCPACSTATAADADATATAAAAAA